VVSVFEPMARRHAAAWLTGDFEREEFEVLAAVVADAPCGLGQLSRAEVEALVGETFLLEVPEVERGVGYLQWLHLLHALKRWQRARPGEAESFYREAVQRGFLLDPGQLPAGSAPGEPLSASERLAMGLVWVCLRFRREHPGLAVATWWLAPLALLRWARSASEASASTERAEKSKVFAEAL
jgi:hypothetical protein